MIVTNAGKVYCVKKPEKTRDLAIPVRRSNQLSYEATDVGSRSIVGSYVPVKMKNASDVYEINHMKSQQIIVSFLIL